MNVPPARIEQFLQQHADSILVEVSGVEGSTPRETGAFMLVAGDALLGTIGGGQLEFIAIDTARTMLRNDIAVKNMDVPLGPAIGQCCGGHVKLELNRLDVAHTARLMSFSAQQAEEAPHIYIFGAGHVGRALAQGLAPLPYRTMIVDTRPDVFSGLSPEITTKCAALPEAVVRSAKPASAFVVLTHDHALDFLIMAEVLKRGDALYAGMIGSKTKRARFRRWFYGEGGARDQFRGLVCPIGAQGLGDKRPEIIAALTTAEIICNFGDGACAAIAKGANLVRKMGAVHGA
jgi:xanthine dehydrogenase accessory factor